MVEAVRPKAIIYEADLAHTPVQRGRWAVHARRRRRPYVVDAVERESACLVLVSRTHQAYAVRSAEIDQSGTAFRVEAGLAQCRIVVIGLTRVIQEQRLVQEERDREWTQFGKHAFEPCPLLGFGGLAGAAHQLGIEAHESPA